MKLYYSPTSPYVRKVVACAIIRGLDGRIERHTTNPHESPADLVADNPLSKVPCLITDDGLSLFGSQLICEYLDSLGDELPLFPERGAPRWRALKFQSLGDGILDAAVPCRGELGKPKEEARDAQIARYMSVIGRTVDTLETDPPQKHIDIGSITVACALGYLDFRFGSHPWRPGHPRLTAWYEPFAQNKGLAETVPGQNATTSSGIGKSQMPLAERQDIGLASERMDKAPNPLDWWARTGPPVGATGALEPVLRAVSVRVRPRQRLYSKPQFG